MSRSLLSLVIALICLPTVALAGPTVERGLSELPARIGTDTELVVVSERPGAVHWAVDGWQRPDPALWPARTVAVGPVAVETPLEGPAVDGRYRAHLGPFTSGAGSIQFVLHYADGSWGKASGRDADIAIVAGTEVRRRPITVGPGPFLGRSGRIDHFEDLQDWEYLDARGLDPADDARDTGPLADGKASSRDLIAFYSRREADQLFLRADLLDLGLGDEQGALDLTVLVDCAPGGQHWLPDFVSGKTAGQWDLAVLVDAGGAGRLLTSQWQSIPGFGDASFRFDLDAVELSISQDALRVAGWDGRSELGFWVYTTKDGEPVVADAFAEADLADGSLDSRIPESSLGGTAKYSVILHGNQAVQPLRWLDDLVQSTTTLTPNGNPTGYLRALDAHEILREPVNIHISGTLAATAEWGRPDFNDRVRRFLDGRLETGSGVLMGGVLAEHMMPYFENARSAHGGGGMNDYSVRLNDELLDRIYGGPPRNVFWIPERVVRGSTFADVLQGADGRDTGYRYAVVDQFTHAAQWFGHRDAHGTNGFKVNHINGVSCFLINDDADQWKFANSDGGLWIWTRRDLVAKALHPDQEQLTLVFDDWEAFSGRSFTSFGVGNDNPDNYETNLRWIANHPWIQVVTLEDVASWGWREVDRRHQPNLPLETYDWLRHATETSYDNWYYGSALEEPFVSLRPERTPGVRIPKAFGEIDQRGGLFHDVWAQVAGAPAGRLKDLAAAIFSVDVFETAWHDEDMNDYLSKTPSGDYAVPDVTYDPIAFWARAMHARVGDAGIAAAAAYWSAMPPTGTLAYREDVDQDGEEEYILCDPHAFFVFENDGARLVMGAVRDPSTGAAEPVICQLLNAPGGETSREQDATRDEEVTRANGLVDWWAMGAGSRYVNALYQASSLREGWGFRSDDGKVTKEVTLRGGQLTVRYRLDPSLGTVYVRSGLSPATLDLFMGARIGVDQRAGALITSATNAAGRRVELAIRPLSGATLNAGADFGGKGALGVPFAHQVELSGQGDFSFRFEPAIR